MPLYFATSPCFPRGACLSSMVFASVKVHLYPENNFRNSLNVGLCSFRELTVLGDEVGNGFAKNS